MNILDIASRDISHLDPKVLEKTLESPFTLVIPSDAPALLAARIIDANHPTLVALVNDKREIEGLLHPSWIINGMKQHKGRVVRTLSEAVKDIMSDPLEVTRGFHHEWMSGRQDMFKCPGPKQHYSAFKPCPRHP